MQITITKGRNEDRIALRRADGSSAETRFPKKGPVPHDAVHYFVEHGLRLDHAFWGMVAAGRHPEELAGLAKAGGHASASRAGEPDAGIVELIQAERLVECFEAELWGGSGDSAALLEVARVGWAASLVPPPAVTLAELDAVRAELANFVRTWTAAPAGHIAAFAWG